MRTDEKCAQIKWYSKHNSGVEELPIEDENWYAARTTTHLKIYFHWDFQGCDLDKPKDLPFPEYIELLNDFFKWYVKLDKDFQFRVLYLLEKQYGEDPKRLTLEDLLKDGKFDPAALIENWGKLRVYNCSSNDEFMTKAANIIYRDLEYGSFYTSYGLSRNLFSWFFDGKDGKKYIDCFVPVADYVTISDEDGSNCDTRLVVEKSDINLDFLNGVPVVCD